jgi:hypothetical protein
MCQKGNCQRCQTIMKPFPFDLDSFHLAPVQLYYKAAPKVPSMPHPFIASRTRFNHATSLLIYGTTDTPTSKM